MRQSYSVLHLFCGIGGAALGMQNAETLGRCFDGKE